MSVLDNLAERFRKQSSGWRLSGTSGVSAGLSACDFIGGGGSIGHVFVEDPSGTSHELDYAGLDGSVGIPNPSLPGYGDIARQSFPADGFGKLMYVRPWDESTQMSLDDLTGLFVEYQFTGYVLAASVSMSLIFLGAPGISGAASVIPGMGIAATAATSKAVGLMRNSSLHVEGVASAGVTVRYGMIVDSPM